jgi:transposase
MTMLAEITTCVIGVDPDKARIQVAAIDSVTRGELATESFANTPDGHDAALAWADGYSDAQSRAWAVEGSGSYGARLTRSLQACGEWVIDFSFPSGVYKCLCEREVHQSAGRSR